MNLTEHRARLQQADEKVDKGKTDGAAEERSDTSLDPNQGTHKRAPDSWTHMLLRFFTKNFWTPRIIFLAPHSEAQPCAALLH